MGIFRMVALTSLLALAGCGGRRPAPRAPVDVWKLAPDGTTTTFVMTMHGYERLGTGVRIAREVVPALGEPREPGEASAEQEFVVTSEVSPREVGLVEDAPLTSFYGPWGHVDIFQTTDSRTFNRARGGTTKDGLDHFDNEVCKELRGVYACADTPEELALVGTGAGIAAPAAPEGIRPDILLVTTERDDGPMKVIGTLLEPTGPLALAVQIDEGVVTMRAVAPGRPRGPLAAMSTAPRSELRTDGVSAYVATSVGFLASIPPPHDPSQQALIQLVRGVGWMPLDGSGAQISLELADAAPVRREVAACGEDEETTAGEPRVIFTDPARPGECQIEVPAPLSVKGTAWVEDKVLRVAAARGPMSPPTGALATPAAALAVLGGRPWTTIAWARGVVGMDPPLAGGFMGLTPETLGPASQVNELGLGIDVRPDGVEVAFVMRLAHAEPEATRAELVAALATGDVMAIPDRLRAFAAAHPGSRLADDVAAGAAGAAMVWLSGTFWYGTFAATVPELRAAFDSADAAP